MKKKKRKKKKPLNQDTYEFVDIESDEYFYYIAGYTSGGAPFGITWEEAIEEGLVEKSELEDEGFIERNESYEKYLSEKDEFNDSNEDIPF